MRLSGPNSHLIRTQLELSLLHRGRVLGHAQLGREDRLGGGGSRGPPCPPAVYCARRRNARARLRSRGVLGVPAAVPMPGASAGTSHGGGASGASGGAARCEWPRAAVPASLRTQARAVAMAGSERAGGCSCRAPHAQRPTGTVDLARGGVVIISMHFFALSATSCSQVSNCAAPSVSSQGSRFGRHG